MTTLRQAAQQALEALEPMQNNRDDTAIQRTITALRAALAEPEFPIGQATTDVGVTVYVVKKAEPVEPVAWQWLNSAYFRRKPPANAESGAWNPLYTAPPRREWRSLSEEERDAVNGVSLRTSG